MKFIRLAACAVLATPLVLFAEPGAPRPSPRSGGGPPHSTTGASRDSDRGGSRGERNKEDMELFRENMEKFCKDHAPRRWAAMGGDKNPMKFGGMYFRFRGLTMLEKQDKALYDIKVRQIEIDDEEYGLMKDVRALREKPDAAELDRLTVKLRDLSKEYIASRIDERTHRIASLQKTIEAEKTALAADQLNQGKLIADRVEAILNDTPPASRSRSREGEGATTQPPAGESAPVIGKP